MTKDEVQNEIDRLNKKLNNPIIQSYEDFTPEFRLRILQTLEQAETSKAKSKEGNICNR